MSHRLALDPPSTNLALLTQRMLDDAASYSRESPRRRVIAPFHRSENELLHRMLNAVQPDSYVRPHRHLSPPKAEAWILLRGSLLFFTFDEDGNVQTAVRVGAGGETFGVDLVPGIFHSFIALEPDTIIYEVKSGPYEKSSDKDFAAWAPAEGTDAAKQYMAQLRERYLSTVER